MGSAEPSEHFQAAQLHSKCTSNLSQDCNDFQSYASAAISIQVLVEKARVEAEDAQRLLLSALNGLAGIRLIEKDIFAAVGLYRQVCCDFLVYVPFTCMAPEFLDFNACQSLC